MAARKSSKKHSHGKGRGTHKFRTPSGSVSAAARRKAVKEHHAMPDGSFPINNLKDLKDAKRSVGRAKDPAAARAWIDKRARELGAPPLGASKKRKSHSRKK